MAGFFGIFGNKTKYIDETDTNQDSEAQTKPEAFYLTADEAKTFGNIEFMRSPIKGKKNADKQQNTLAEIKNEYLPKNNGGNNSTSSSKGNDNLDMFRNMAKEIKK